ncbi:hypothetical protein KEM52_001292, partial [Ascosphaera acerosa]
FVRELALHIGAVEEVILPWISYKLSQGKAIVAEETRRNEEVGKSPQYMYIGRRTPTYSTANYCAQVKRKVRKLQRLKPSDARFPSAQQQGIAAVEEEVQYEDTTLLVPIERTLDTADLKDKAGVDSAGSDHWRGT